MLKQLWIGTRGHMRWISAPSISSADFSKVAWGASTQYLNGGIQVRRSKASHKEYTMSWGTRGRDELRFITDLADGIYDTSDETELIYFVDPMAADKNVLPQLWASPAQARADALTLFPGQKPSVTATPANALDYPARSAVYTTNTASSSIWLPIPPGFVAWVGIHGSATGAAGVLATKTVGTSTLTQSTLTMLDVTSTTRVTDQFSSADCDGILLSLTNGGPTSTDTITLSGLMVQILPLGGTPLTGGFISGQGNSGCQFAGQPQQTPLSNIRDQMSMSAKLIETGSWL